MENHHHPKSRNTGALVTSTATGASGTVLYTCPAKNKGEVHLLTISNPKTVSISVTVEVYNSQAGDYYKVVDTFGVEPNSILYVVNNEDKIFLNPTDKIIVSASIGSNLTSYIAVRETYGEALA